MRPTIAASAARLRSGRTTARDLLDESLQALSSVDPDLSSFVLVDEDGARAAAAEADALLGSGGPVGPLTGVPVAVKDIIDMSGLPTRCGSPAYAEDPANTDAGVTTLLRSAGAVIVGKTTAHELACGVYSAPASNPWATDRLPGGSSGGSGAAVASGIVPMALGSDTGGSIRIPAAVCGVAGLKPTFGLVSTEGVEPLSWSLDHIGPLGATVEDCALTLEAIVGPAVDRGAPDYTSHLDRGVAGLRLGILDREPFAPMQPGVEAAFNGALSVLRESGAALERVHIPELEHTLAAEFGIVGPEAAAYHRDILHRRPHLIDPGIRLLLVAGTLLPDVQYLKALEARRAIAAALRRAFHEHCLDALVTPTLPATAAGKQQDEFRYGSGAEAVTLSYVRTTAPFNLSGLPALSVPCGYDEAGLPVGLQVAGKPFDEATVLRIGAAYEAATAWHLDAPPVNAFAEVA